MRHQDAGSGRGGDAAAVALAAIAALAAFGCTASNPPAADLVPAAPHQWLYWPVGLRIHPLTRVLADRETGRPLIEMRVEFVDRDGVTTRAVGEMYISYFESRGHLPGEPLEKWRVELDVPAVNAERFDVVTRTYLFKLVVDLDAPPTEGVLQAYFVGSDGREIADTLDLE